MKCFKCGTDALAGSKFCPHCGASMSVGAGQPAGGMAQNQPNPGQGGQNMQMQTPGYQNMQIQNPGYQNMQIQTPGHQNMQIQTPGYQTPGYQNPGYQTTGYQNPGYQNPGLPVPVHSGDSLATSSMVLGIAADVAFVISLLVAASAEQKLLGYRTGYIDETTATLALLLMVGALICALIGFVLAISSLIKKTEKKGKAIAGFVCNGILMIPLLVLIITFMVTI